LYIGLTVACLGVPLRAAQAPEYQLKAVFLYQFAQFVEWPSQAFSAVEAPFSVCVLGNDPFSTLLDETVDGETVKGRHLAVRRYRKVEDLKDCNILFITQSEMATLESTLDALKGRPILTVGDADSFAKRGGAIEFFTASNKLKLRINPEAAKAADLTISSKLLRLADIVPAARG
jgi:hypothetical protein